MLYIKPYKTQKIINISLFKTTFCSIVICNKIWEKTSKETRIAVFNHCSHVFISWMAISIICRVATNIITIWICVKTTEMSIETIVNETVIMIVSSIFLVYDHSTCTWGWIRFSPNLYPSDNLGCYAWVLILEIDQIQNTTTLLNIVVSNNFSCWVMLL